MKILCVIDSLGSGGAQRQLVSLALEMKEKGYSVSFLVYHPFNFYKDLLDNAHIPVLEVIESNYLKRLLKMRKVIRQGNYDVLISFLEAASFICEISGLPWRKWKLIVGERSANPNIFKSTKLKFYRWVHLLADYVISNSFENIKMVRKINPLLSQKKCKVIYNIIDFEKWKPSSQYVPRKDGKLKILIAASHQELKNLNGLVEAVSLLSGKEKDQLIIEWFGDIHDKSYEKAKEKINEHLLNTVFHFYPATLKINEKMQLSDVVGLFSFYEGFPNAICEGMALGKLVICSNISDIPLILSNTSNFIINPAEPLSIMNALSKILTLKDIELTRIGTINRQLAEEYFDQEKIIEQYLKLII